MVPFLKVVSTLILGFTALTVEACAWYYDRKGHDMRT
jgi:hypothetical protein